MRFAYCRPTIYCGLRELSAIEIEALTAGFSKARVRRTFTEKRLASIPDMPEGLRDFMERQIALQDRDALLQRYWDD